MSDPVKQCINLIFDQLHVHGEMFHNIEDWSKEFTAVLNQHHEEVSTAFHSVADLIADQERRISALEAKVKELSSDD